MVVNLGKPLKQENNDVFLKYYENISKAVLGNDVNFMKVRSGGVVFWGGVVNIGGGIVLIAFGF